MTTLDTTIDIHRIMKILPHRYPFLLIDRVLDYEVGKTLTAVKNVTVNEPFFQGHFPHYPVFPGVLILEAMAQASAILASLGLGAEASSNTIYLFAGVDKARFKRPVEPGDQMIFEIEQKMQKRRIWKCDTRVTVDGKLCATSDVIFTYKEV